MNQRRGARRGARWLRAAMAVACIATLGQPRAQAQQIPALETGTPIVRARLIDGQLELRDMQTNTPLVVPRGMKLLSPLDPRVRATVTLQEQPTGADIITTYTNTGELPLPVGMLNLGVITLGPNITYLNPMFMQDFVSTQVASFVGQAWGYPDFAYSPVWVLTNPTCAVGVSLQYPILEYQHDTTLWIDNPRGEYLAGEGGRGWSVHFGLSNSGDESHQRVLRSASLPPGASRTYVMSVRISKDPADWMRTLLPYRDYFRSMYGGVTYTRRVAPIMGMGVSDKSFCTAENPRGWAPEFRPDVYGWSKVVTYIKQYLPGWPSIMFWTPSGYYRNNRTGNYPPQICTPWLETTTLSTAFDPTSGLPSLVKAGKEIGVWWGRSCQVSPGGWDPPYLEDFDPDRADHLQGKLQELDLAVKAGARTVGLDTFGTRYTPLWKLYEWMRLMRLRHPDVHFMMEPRPCDVMHTIAPSVLNGWNDRTPPVTTEDLYAIKHPLWLADFLLPGHETWAVYRYTEWQQYYGIIQDQARVIADMQRHAAMGFTPLMQVPGNIQPTPINVVNSWEQTVPADLRLPATVFPFGAVRDGSAGVALGTSAYPTRGGGNGAGVRGWTPSKPGASLDAAAPSSAAPEADPSAEPRAAAGAALSKKVVVRRAGPRHAGVSREAAPPSPEPASEVSTFYGSGTGSDRVTVVLPPTTTAAPKKP